jgi:hypothetical protein
MLRRRARGGIVPKSGTLMSTISLDHLGYRYIPGPFQYSAGVAALPGHSIERVRFANPVPLDEGFSRIERYLKERGVAVTSFCACELRSPAPFTEEGFRAFNRVYVGTLERWGIFKNDVNPVARANTCPQVAPPPVPSFQAFSYVVPTPSAMKSFVIAGGAESQEGNAPYQEKTVRYGETSPDAIREKAMYTLSQMEKRLEAFGCAWADTTAVQLYTVHDSHPFMGEEIVRRGAARHGLTWHFNRPPVQGIEYEMDCRGVDVERVIPG